MGRALVLLAVIALAVTTGSAGATRGATRPVLRVVDDTSLVIRGARFQAYEHVRVVVVTSRHVLARTRAGIGGTFVVRLPGVDVNACAGFSVIATGDLGSRAVFKRAPGQCPAP
jgi:hypothetical protein